MPTSVESQKISQHGTWIEIRLDRLLANLKAVRLAAGPGAEVLAVVKANAYGHGLVQVAKTLAPETKYLGVSNPQEALELKEHGIETPVFFFGRLFSPELPPILIEGITLSISSLEEAEEISALSVSLGRRTTVHLKIDTGMGRMGIPQRQALAAVPKIAALPGLTLEGIYTHFPTAEREDGFSEKQVRDFRRILDGLKETGLSFAYRHAANSAASVKLSDEVFNLIRPGILLYGLYPDASLAEKIRVSPILSLKSRIIMLKRLRKGESAGYGRQFVAETPTTLAVLPIGYSDGYPFQASGKAFVLYHGRPYPVAGRVSMDYLAVNLGDAPARLGDQVTLLGEDGGESITAGDLAAWAGTIPYEIVTRLASRIPRFYRP